jgi:hypothetical protein
MTILHPTHCPICHQEFVHKLSIADGKPHVVYHHKNDETPACPIPDSMLLIEPPPGIH